MIYKSLNHNAEKRKFFIDWLRREAQILDRKFESPNSIVFESEDGDVVAAKDLVGNFLATLTNETIEIQ